jgi:Transmembrane amino acid transporter protein
MKRAFSRRSEGSCELVIRMPEGESSKSEEHHAVYGFQLAPPPGAEGKHSENEAVFNYLNAMLGGGLLGYPYSYKNCGLVLTSVLVLLGLLTCQLSMNLLLLASQLSNQRTYEGLAKQVLHPQTDRCTHCICSSNSRRGIRHCCCLDPCIQTTHHIPMRAHGVPCLPACLPFLSCTTQSPRSGFPHVYGMPGIIRFAAGLPMSHA